MGERRGQRERERERGRGRGREKERRMERERNEGREMEGGRERGRERERDLQASVDFQKIEIPASVHNKLYRPRANIPNMDNKPQMCVRVKFWMEGGVGRRLCVSVWV